MTAINVATESNGKEKEEVFRSVGEDTMLGFPMFRTLLDNKARLGNLC